MRGKTRNLENRVYRCTWEQNGAMYVLRCESPVRAVARSTDILEARQRLLEKVMTVSGDGEPFLQFVPDLPKKSEQKGFFNPPLFDLGWNEQVEWTLPEDRTPNILYEGGLCKKCNLGIGIRTDVPRVVTKAPRYDICGFYKDRQIGAMISEDVLRHLRKHLAKDVAFVPVEMSSRIEKRVKKKYFELSFEPIAETVVPSGAEHVSGWQCKGCKTLMVHWNVTRIGASAYALDRAHADAAIVLVRNGPRRCIAIGKKVFETLAKDKNIRGLVCERVALLDLSERLSDAAKRKLKLPQIEV